MPINDDTTQVVERAAVMLRPNERLELAQDRELSVDIMRATSQALYRLETRLDDANDEASRTLAKSRARLAELVALREEIEALSSPEEE